VFRQFAVRRKKLQDLIDAAKRIKSIPNSYGKNLLHKDELETSNKMIDT